MVEVNKDKIERTKDRIRYGEEIKYGKILKGFFQSILKLVK